MTDHLDVVWLSLHDDTIARGYWDQGLLEDVLAGAYSTMPPVVHHLAPEGLDGATVVIPARHHAADADRINDLLSPLRWAVVILTGDEDAAFPAADLRHPRMRLWVQSPHPERHESVAHRPFPCGYPPHVRPALAAIGDAPRTVDVSFAGQVTHPRRHACAAAVEGLGGEVHASAGFTQGLAPDSYAALLARSRIVACPSGPVHPDTFRIYEALEAGCVPLVDGHAPGWGHTWWARGQFGGDPPFPVVVDWSEIGPVVADVLADWPWWAARAQAWWVAHKRLYGLDLLADVAAVSE